MMVISWESVGAYCWSGRAMKDKKAPKVETYDSTLFHGIHLLQRAILASATSYSTVQCMGCNKTNKLR